MADELQTISQGQPQAGSSNQAALRFLRGPLKIGPAFWTITGVISLVVNLVLLVVLILVGRELFGIKALLNDQLIGGLATNFALMDQAKITTNVVVQDTIPVQFTLPVSQNTTVVLTKDTHITGATVNLSTGGLSITNAPADIVLPAGTPLKIQLEMDIPVDASVPISLNVPVDIPLNQTELHEPFVGLQNVVAPYQKLLDNLPDSWEEIFCGGDGTVVCALLP